MARARGFCGGDVMLRISLAPKCMDDAGGSWPCTRHSSLLIMASGLHLTPLLISESISSLVIWRFSRLAILSSLT